MTRSRRSFLYGTFGAAAAGAVAAETGSDNPRPSSVPFKLGVATYSLRGFNRTVAIEHITRDLHERYVNVKDFHMPMSPVEETARARKDFEKAGLIILGGGTVSFRSKDPADIRSRFDYAKTAGMPLIVAAPNRDVLPLLEPYVKEYGIKVAVHNHGPEDKQFPTPESILEVIGGMDPRVGLCMDVGHTARTGDDVVESIRKAGARLLDMHVKDLANLKDKDSQVPVGDGKMPIPAIFRELKRMNYAGGVMLEYEIDESNPIPGMLKSFAYMRGVLAGMSA
jgi:sugar phosphate isomerase/epimerase